MKFIWNDELDDFGNCHEASRLALASGEPVEVTVGGIDGSERNVTIDGRRASEARLFAEVQASHCGYDAARNRDMEYRLLQVLGGEALDNLYRRTRQNMYYLGEEECHDLVRAFDLVSEENAYAVSMWIGSHNRLMANLLGKGPLADRDRGDPSREGP